MVSINKKLILNLLLIVLCSTFAMSQEIKFISGKVIDSEENFPMLGVSVIVKGSTNGVTTGADGFYSIQATSNDIIEFSFVGYESVAEKVGSRLIIDVSLSLSSEELDQIIVTALGIKRSEKKLGYSVSLIKSDEITKTTANLSSALSGKIAGVQVSGGVGSPGSSVNVTLRGYANIGRNTQPLYVIDGVMVSNIGQNFGNTASNLNRSLDFGNGVNDIASLDIESMSILRGAAATSLYGSRASNGVIMITTKSGTANLSGGRKNAPILSFNTSTVFSSLLRVPLMQSQFGQGWDGRFASEENGSWGPKYSNDLRLWGNTVDNKRLYKKNSFIGEDAYREFFEYGVLFDNSISLSGAGKVANYYASYNNVSSDGIVPKDKDKFIKHSFKVKSGFNLGKISATSSINFINKSISAIPTGLSQGGAENLFDVLLETPADISFLDMRNYEDKKSYYNPNNFFSPYVENPYFVIDNSNNDAVVNRFLANTSIIADLIPKYRLKSTLRFGGEFQSSSTQLYDRKHKNDSESPNSSKTEISGLLSEYSKSDIQYSGDFIVSGGYDFLNGDLKLDGMIGANIFSTSFERHNTKYTELLFYRDFPSLANGKGTPTVYGRYYKKRTLGLYGNVDLGYHDYLFLNLSLRNEWTSTLPKGNNSFLYPAVSLGFILTDAFEGMKNISFLEYLKLRVSYGVSGNDAPISVLDPVNIKGSVNLPFSEIDYPIKGITGYEVSNTLGNKKLKPELSYDFEIGTDIRLLNNRIGLDFTYYRKKTEGLILDRTVSGSSGYTSIYDNIGVILNEGFEVSFNVTPIKIRNNFSWDLTYMFHKNNNKILSLTQGLKEVLISGFTTMSIYAIEGKTVSQAKGPATELSPDGKIIVEKETGRPITSTKNVDFGTTLYDFTMSLSNTIRYKNISLSFLFDYRHGGQFFSATKEYLSWTGKDPLTTFNNRKPFIVPNSVYKEEDKNGKDTFHENTQPISRTDLNNYHATRKWNSKAQLLDKTFLKLRELSLTYNLSKSVIDKTPFSNMSISVFGSNLLLFTPSSNNVVDPEVTTLANGGDSEYGEIGGYPSVRNYGFRINFKF